MRLVFQHKRHLYFNHREMHISRFKDVLTQVLQTASMRLIDTTLSSEIAA